MPEELKVYKYQSPHLKEAEFFELDEVNTPQDSDFVRAKAGCNSMYLVTGKFDQKIYKKEFTSVADENEHKWYAELKGAPPIHNVKRPIPQVPGMQAAAAAAKQAHMLKVMMGVIGAAKHVQHAWNMPEPECFPELEKAKGELNKSLAQFEEFMKALDLMNSKSPTHQFSGK